MTEPRDSYIPLAQHRRLEVQASKAWRAGSLVVFGWTAAIVAAPILMAAGFAWAAIRLYRFFGYFCHQLPERSMYVAGFELAVCSRCFGIYLGLLAGFVLYPAWRSLDNFDPLPRFWLFFSMVPIAVDWSLTAFGIWENTHASRFVTGAILGSACGVYIVPAIVEITRNFTLSRARAT